MQENFIKNSVYLAPPPCGWIKELAERANCTTRTVRRAIRENARGKKCDHVRELYNNMYAQGTTHGRPTGEIMPESAQE